MIATRLPAVCAVAAALGLSGCVAGLIGPTSPPYTPAYIGYIDDGRLHVITSSGRTALLYPTQVVRRASYGRVWDCRYSDPVVHAESHRVLVVQRCGGDTPVNRIIQFTLDSADLAPHTLYEGAGRGPNLPAWSSDGRRTAFLEMDDLVACAADCQMTFRTRIPRPHGNWTQLTWQPDHRRVLLKAEGPTHTTSIAAVEPDAGHFEWLAERLEPAALEQWIADPTHAPVVRALFGSAANPREPIAWSPDGRYYFYEAFDQHFRNRGAGWGSHWIAGYDTERAKIRRIKTVERTFNIPPFSWIE